MPGENPFAKYAPAAGPVYGPPPKAEPPPSAMQLEDQQFQRDRARRDELEWNAKNNPDGTPKQKTGKALRQGDNNTLTALGGNLSEYQELHKTFDDDFGGNTFTGSLESTAQGLNSSLGTPGQRDWWSRMSTLDNAIRHDTFGATLTPGEKASYAQTTISQSMDPKEIRTNLARRAEILAKAARRKATSLKAAGWNEEEIDALVGEQLEQGQTGKERFIESYKRGYPNGNAEAAWGRYSEAKAKRAKGEEHPSDIDAIMRKYGAR